MIYPNLYIIVAATANERGIGYKNAMLFHAPEDLQYYKATTLGHTVIMGFRTYLSLPRRPLPGRVNLLLSRQDRSVPPEVLVMHSVAEILEHVALHPAQTFFVSGGEQVYKQFMPYSSRLYLTWFLDDPLNKVDLTLVDAFFPDIDPAKWVKIKEFAEEANLRSAHPHVFAIYQRKNERSFL